MPIEVLTFYHPLPRFGEKLSDQWNEFRDDFDALAPIVRASYMDIATNTGSHDLAGFAQGELNFRNRYRVFYDKAAEEWKIQFNKGTEAVENFVDYVRIRNEDGRFIVEGEGGLESAHGFYNVDFLSVDTVPDGGYNQSNVTTLKINSFDGFYWSTDTAGGVILNLNQNFGISKTQEFALASEWTFTHNIGATPIMTHTYNGIGIEITPNKTDISDPNITYFYFDPQQAGEAIVASGGLGAVTVNTITNPFYVVVRESDGDKFVLDQGEAGIVFDSAFFYVQPVSNPNEVLVSFLSTYTPANSSDWSGDPTSVEEAIDRIAAAVATAHGAIG